MLGGIYSERKCPVCGKALKYNGRTVACPDHPECQSDRGLLVKLRGVRKRFDGDLAGAERFVTGLRFKIDEKTFDQRDYAVGQPLGFDTLIGKFVDYKMGEIRCVRSLRCYTRVAAEHFKNKSVKEIDFGELDDFARSLKCGQKTKHNYLSAVHHFFVWCKRRKLIDRIPDFPTIKFTLGYRNVIGKETQAQIIEEVGRIACYKAYLAVKFLATYINVRPNEMRRLKWKHIDLENGHLTFPDPKEKRYKISPLIPEDLELIKALPTPISQDMFFFTKDNGEPFGRTFVYRQWVTACRNLGIKDIDLYGGTRHSSARALTEHFSPERIKRAIGSTTNAAFERYYRIESDEVRAVFSQTSNGTVLGQLFSPPKVRNSSKL
jgi:integrase